MILIKTSSSRASLIPLPQQASGYRYNTFNSSRSRGPQSQKLMMASQAMVIRCYNDSKIDLLSCLIYFLKVDCIWTPKPELWLLSSIFNDLFYIIPDEYQGLPNLTVSRWSYFPTMLRPQQLLEGIIRPLVGPFIRTLSLGITTLARLDIARIQDFWRSSRPASTLSTRWMTLLQNHSY